MKTFVYRLPAETSPKKVKISRNRKAERYRYFSSNYRLATHISRPDAHTRQGILWKTIFEICNFILHISLPQKPYRPLLSSHQFSPENTQTAKKCIPLSLRFTPEMARSFSDHARNGSDDVTRFRKHFVRFAKRKKAVILKNQAAAKLTFTENFARSLKSDPPTDNSPRKYHRRQRKRFSKCNGYYLITI